MKSLTELLSLPSPIAICDIGAALGEKPSYQHLVDSGTARIIGFEPIASECQRLNETYGPPHQFFPYLIGDGERHSFRETNYSMTSSLFEPNEALNSRFNNLAELMQVIARYPVSTRRLDDVLEIDDIDFIKIDVQGAELMIFQNAPRLLHETLLVQTEVLFVHHYIDQPLFSDIDIELRSKGFQFHTFQGFGSRAFKPLIPSAGVNAGVRQIIWTDAVYVRDWMKLDLLPTDKLRKYAVLMHDVMSSPDLCHVVLDELGRREGIEWAARYREVLGVSGIAPE